MRAHRARTDTYNVPSYTFLRALRIRSHLPGAARAARATALPYKDANIPHAAMPTGTLQPILLVTAVRRAAGRGSSTVSSELHAKTHARPHLGFLPNSHPFR